MSTYTQKPKDITRDWYVIDATGVSLGRISSFAAQYLVGKHKPTYTPHIDAGDNIVIINAADVKITGNKLNQKRYFRHTGYPGGIKSLTLGQLMSKDPGKVVEKAVLGMLPSNKLRDARAKRLKVYTGADHPHEPQKPKLVKIDQPGKEKENG